MNFHRLALLGALPLLLVASACGVSVHSGATFSEGVQLSPPVSYVWDAEWDRVRGDSRLEGNQFFVDRLREAVGWELSLRNVRATTEDPDLLIHHHLTLRDHVMVEETIDEEGYVREEVYAYQQGTIVVHIVDARTNDDVWVGWAQADVGPAMRGPDQMRRWVYRMVAHMFESWPTE